MLFDDNRLKQVHINRTNLHQNQRRGLNDPVIVVIVDGEMHEGYRARILGPSEVVYEPTKPLSTGALVWVETNAPVELT